MAFFFAQILKHLGSDKWSNVYHFQATDIDAAVAATTDILIPFEKGIHRDVVVFDHARVSTVEPDDDIFSIIPINDTGDVATSGAQYLPLWNTLRADLSTGGVGRPGRKYYRLPLMEGDQENGLLSTGVASAIQPAIQSMLEDMDAAGNNLSSPENVPYTDASVFPAVQMRQLHRRRRRTPAP